MTKIIKGSEVLRFYDVHGLPMETIKLAMEELGMCYDVFGFFVACAKNPNFSLEKSIAIASRGETDKEILYKIKLTAYRAWNYVHDNFMKEEEPWFSWYINDSLREALK